MGIGFMAWLVCAACVSHIGIAIGLTSSDLLFFSFVFGALTAGSLWAGGVYLIAWMNSRF